MKNNLPWCILKLLLVYKLSMPQITESSSQEEKFKSINIFKIQNLKIEPGYDMVFLLFLLYNLLHIAVTKTISSSWKPTLLPTPHRSWGCRAHVQKVLTSTGRQLWPLDIHGRSFLCRGPVVTSVKGFCASLALEQPLTAGWPLAHWQLEPTRLSVDSLHELIRCHRRLSTVNQRSISLRV